MRDYIKTMTKKYWLLLALVALAQTFALVWMVGARVSLLSTGREVVLETVPVDPRSLFRGDYVRLGYNISSIDKKLITGNVVLSRNDTVYVTVRAKGTEKAVPIAVSSVRPTKLRPGEVVIRAIVTYNPGGDRSKFRLRLRYGLERFYVPEGEGRRLEHLVGKKNFSVLVAVSGDGEAAIKGLMIDDKLQFEEPLF